MPIGPTHPSAGQSHACDTLNVSNDIYHTHLQKKGCEYKFYTEFQSHEPEFDYLKSLEIEEKINQIKWCPRQNAAHFILSTNGSPSPFQRLRTRTHARPTVVFGKQTRPLNYGRCLKSRYASYQRITSTMANDHSHPRHLVSSCGCPACSSRTTLSPPLHERSTPTPTRTISTRSQSTQTARPISPQMT